MANKEPSKKLSISDFDGVFYELNTAHVYELNKAFALAAQALSPDTARTLNHDDLRHLSVKFYGHPNTLFDNISIASKQENSIGVYFKELNLDALDPINLARTSFLLTGDSTDFFVTLSEDTPYRIHPREMHYITHRIWDTRKWEPVKGLAKSIQALQKQGEFVIWTHGTKEHVLRNMDRLGIYGLVNEEKIFDVYSFGRKDRDADPYHQLCNKFDVDPQNAALYEDTLRNLDIAKDAGLNTVGVMQKTLETIPASVDRIHRTSEKAFRNVAEHLETVHGSLSGSPTLPQGAVSAANYTL